MTPPAEVKAAVELINRWLNGSARAVLGAEDGERITIAKIRAVLMALSQATEENERLHRRLEDNFAWVNGERVAVEPGSIPDGIECRDETIKLLDENVAALRARATKAEAALAAAEEALKAEHRQKRAYLDEIDRQKVKIAEQSGVLEWIANHRNDGLTDGSPATRTCLDEIVNLSAAALLAPASPADQKDSNQ